MQTRLTYNMQSLMACKVSWQAKTDYKKCGFIIHPTLGWLGASPDAFVTDPHSCLPDGIAEFKCPYSKREMTPIDACQDPKFLFSSGREMLRILNKITPIIIKCNCSFLLVWTCTTGMISVFIHLKNIEELESYFRATLMHTCSLKFSIQNANLPIFYKYHLPVALAYLKSMIINWSCSTYITKCIWK